MGSIKVALIAIAMAGPALVGSGGEALAQTSGVEPKAGTWRTWVLTSGRSFGCLRHRTRSRRGPSWPRFRAAGPRRPSSSAPSRRRGRAGRGQGGGGQRDSATVERLRRSDAGSPSYRWNELMIEQTSVGRQPLSGGHTLRAFALLNIALHDATIAAWDSKYAYRRPRPTMIDPAIAAAVAVPRNPSYPCEHAVAAGAASEIMAYLWPTETSRFAELAGDATRSRVQAGVQYPSDVRAGLALGRAVAARVIRLARADNSDATWTGTSDPGHWTGHAIAIAEATRKMSVLAPRPDGLTVGWPSDSTGGPNILTYWNRHVSRMVFEDKLEDNPPRAARAYALVMVTVYDTWIAAQDAKRPLPGTLAEPARAAAGGTVASRR